MTFYLGKEIVTYEMKFKVIKKFLRNKLKMGSNSETFRHMVDSFYTEITRVNGKKEKGED